MTIQPDRLTVRLGWCGRVLDGPLKQRVKASEACWSLDKTTVNLNFLRFKAAATAGSSKGGSRAAGDATAAAVAEADKAEFVELMVLLPKESGGHYWRALFEGGAEKSHLEVGSGCCNSRAAPDTEGVHGIHVKDIIQLPCAAEGVGQHLPSVPSKRQGWAVPQAASCYMEHPIHGNVVSAGAHPMHCSAACNHHLLCPAVTVVLLHPAAEPWQVLQEAVSNEDDARCAPSVDELGAEAAAILEDLRERQAMMVSGQWDIERSFDDFRLVIGDATL